MKICNACNEGELEAHFSPCKDFECCGIEDRVECNKCDYVYETFSEERFIEVLKGLGFTDEEIEEER